MRRFIESPDLAGSRRAALTLIEIIVVLLITSMLFMTLAGMFQVSTSGVNAVADRSDLEARGRRAVAVVRSLLQESVRPVNNNFRMRAFQNIPAGWNTGNVPAALHFFADVDDDGHLEWVWIWVDPVGAADPKGDIHPRPPFLKMTAFQRYPTQPWTWADYQHPFFTDHINNDPTSYYIIASNLTLAGTVNLDGLLATIRQGFGVGLQNLNNWTEIQLSTSIDRNQSGTPGHGEPVVLLRERVAMHNHGLATSASFPDALYVSNVLADVKASALPLPLNDPKGRALLER